MSAVFQHSIDLGTRITCLSDESRCTFGDEIEYPHGSRLHHFVMHLIFHRDGLFDERSSNIGLTPISTRVRDWTLVASAPERGIMEMLSLIGGSESSFTYASEHFDSLTSLRSKVVKELLVACNSLEVRRLFLFLASHYAYPWSRKLDRSAIDLGKGKRLIVRGGRYNREFCITVPERFGVAH